MKGTNAMKCYKTVEMPAFDEFTEKRSRFIGYASPVTSEADAIEFVNSIRKKHPDARHNVYAYIVRENNITRFSDDGEPSGTAGIPVLDTLRKQELTDVAVVVTRYFGGILLGGGGLVRAYGHAASIAVAAAHRIKMVYSSVYKIETDYHFLGKVEYALRMMGLSPEGVEYSSGVSLGVCVTEEQEEKMKKNITEITLGTALIKKTEERFVAYEEEEV